MNQWKVTYFDGINVRAKMIDNYGGTWSLINDISSAGIMVEQVIKIERNLDIKAENNQ